MMPLIPEAPERQRQQQHESDLRHLSERLDERRLGRADLVQKGVGERVVELERNAEQERADDEDEEGAVAQQLERIEAQRVACTERRARRLGRRVRQRQRVQPEQHGPDRRHPHRQDQRIGVQDPANHDAGHDPADGAEHADDGELPARIAHVVERDRVGQRECRHVAERVGDQRGIERGEGGLRRGEPEEPAPTRCEDCHEAFAREEAIGHHAEEEWRDQRGDRGGAIGQADLRAREMQRPGQVGAHRDEPCAPDEVLQEHHRRQPAPHPTQRRRSWERSHLDVAVGHRSP